MMMVAVLGVLVIKRVMTVTMTVVVIGKRQTK